MKRPNFSQLHWVTGFSASLLLLVMLNALGWVRVPALAQPILTPLSKPLTRLGQSVGGFFTELTQLGSLNSKNNQLEQENAQLREQVAQLKQLETENQQLRAQLQFPSQSNLQLLGADVVAFAPDTIHELLVINRGSKDGVTVGMPVVSGGQLIGKISQVSGASSFVLLVNDASFRALVIDQETKTPGIIKGQAGGAVVMERIPQTQSINNDDTIITNGQDGEFPPGLIIGKVSGVSNDSQSIFKNAQIQQVVNPYELRVVLVVIAQQ